MPQDEHYEWPSFETVLRDVATSERPPRAEASPSDHLRVDTAPPESDAQPETLHLDPDVDLGSDVFSTDLLPEPLAPIEIDTSAVRALLMPAEDSPIEEFDLRALDPLEPAPTTESVVLDEESVVPDEIETLETESPFSDSAFSDSAFEPESVFDLAFDADAFTATDEPDTATPAVELEDVAGIALPELETTPDIFADLNTDDLSLDDAPLFIDSDSDTDDAEAITDLPSGAVFELDESTISDSESNFDSVATANAIEGELNELSELSDMTALDAEFEDESSVDLFDFDNVVPIRPEPSLDDTTDQASPDTSSSRWLNPTDQATAPLSHAPDGPPPARVTQTGWVGLEEAHQSDATDAPEDDNTVADPWAHMRPTEEPKAEGFLARIFGGDERRKARARRRAKEQSATATNADGVEDDPEISFDSACPNCGGECQVDLDDPIGRRVHVSCPSCDHMWFTPYIEANTG